MAVLAGKLESRRDDCAPVAGKSTLNRLELSREIATRYHKINHEKAAIESLFVRLFLEAPGAPPEQIIVDLDATDPALRPSGRAVFPRLLRLLLLSAAVRVLRPPSAGGQAQALEHRRQRRRGRGSRADRRPGPDALAQDAHPAGADSGFAREALMAWCDTQFA